MGSRSTQTPLTLHRRLTKSTLLLIPLFGVHYVVFALFPKHVGVDARLYFELVLGSYQVRWAGKVSMGPPQTLPGAPRMWGFSLFWKRVPQTPGARHQGWAWRTWRRFPLPCGWSEVWEEGKPGRR